MTDDMIFTAAAEINLILNDFSCGVALSIIYFIAEKIETQLHLFIFGWEKAVIYDFQRIPRNEIFALIRDFRAAPAQVEVGIREWDFPFPDFFAAIRNCINDLNLYAVGIKPQPLQPRAVKRKFQIVMEFLGPDYRSKFSIFGMLIVNVR